MPGAVRYELRVWWDPLPAWQPLGETDRTSYTHIGCHRRAGVPLYHPCGECGGRDKRLAAGFCVCDSVGGDCNAHRYASANGDAHRHANANSNTNNCASAAARV